MHPALSPRPRDPRWTVGSSRHHHHLAPAGSASRPTTASSSPTEQLEAFLKERLDNWDVEAAEVVCKWGTVGDMCSPDYQSQLHKAHTTLHEARKGQERQRDEAARRVRHDAQEVARRRYRDRLAAGAHIRSDAKVKAAQRQQQHAEEKKRGTNMGSADLVPTPQVVVRRRSSLCNTSSVTGILHASGGGLTGQTLKGAAPSPTAAAATLRFQMATPSITTRCAAPPGAFACTQAPLRDTANKSPGDDDSSTLSLHSGSNASPSPSTANASHASLGETFSSTFVVRRMLTAHVHVTPGLRHTIFNHSSVKAAHQASVDNTPPATPAPVAAAVSAPSRLPRKASSALLALPRRRGSSSRITAAGTNVSLSPVDPSLPYEDDEVTAIFASRSRSQETTTPQRTRSGSRSVTVARRPATSPQRDLTAHVVSPIKAEHREVDLSSISSAGSYLRGVEGEG